MKGLIISSFHHFNHFINWVKQTKVPNFFRQNCPHQDVNVWRSPSHLAFSVPVPFHRPAPDATRVNRG